MGLLDIETHNKKMIQREHYDRTRADKEYEMSQKKAGEMASGLYGASSPPPPPPPPPPTTPYSKLTTSAGAQIGLRPRDTWTEPGIDIGYEMKEILERLEAKIDHIDQTLARIVPDYKVTESVEYDF